MAEISGQPLYSCRKCRNHVALSADLLSESFVARSGEAYLFDQAMNIVIGAKEERKLITGDFTVANIFCSKCGDEMGWTYVRAFDATQRYKEGKYIMEKAKLVNDY